MQALQLKSRKQESCAEIRIGNGALPPVFARWKLSSLWVAEMRNVVWGVTCEDGKIAVLDDEVIWLTLPGDELARAEPGVVGAGGQRVWAERVAE